MHILMTGIMKDEDKTRNIYKIMEVKKSNFYNETYIERTITTKIAQAYEIE